MKNRHTNVRNALLVFSFFFLFINSTIQAQIVSCYAGSGAVNCIDAPIACNTASFNEPYGIAVDASGTIYVADSRNHKIRKISPAGIVSTLAGSGVAGSADGLGASASFYFPVDLAVDSAGNVYVADRGNSKIRKITPGGIVTTFAGSGNVGSVDALGILASFKYPEGIALDTAGVVYVADSGNNKIRKIDANGLVSTFAGSGTSGSTDGASSVAMFYGPRDITFDKSGTLYVADTYNNMVRKIAAGVVSTLAGSSSGFYYPDGITTDTAGNVYLADTNNLLIRKITPAGVVTTFAGTHNTNQNDGRNDGVGNLVRFYNPVDVAADPSGNIYVCDANEHAIRKITPSGVVSTIAGTGIKGSSEGIGTGACFFAPTGLVFDALGNMYVADRVNNKIRKITPSGDVTTFAGSGRASDIDGTGLAAGFDYPTGITIDKFGTLYVADSYNHKIKKISPAGGVTTVAGSGMPGSADGTGILAMFNNPSGVAVDALGNLYVADSYNCQIRKITPAGVVTTLAGTSGASIPGSVNGTGASASFYTPIGIVIDSLNTMLYVTDAGSSLIRKVSLSGVVTTLAVSFPAASSDGTGTYVGFNTPYGLAIDAANNLYVTDGNKNKIRKVDPAGIVTTIGGSGAQGDANGPGPAASFNRPQGITRDLQGNIYVADTDNNKIRKIGTPVTTAVINPSAHASLFYGLYPNPVQNTLYLTRELNGFAIVLNSTGQCVAQMVIDVNGINVSSLTPGLYFLKVTTSEGSSVHKFLKE